MGGVTEARRPLRSVLLFTVVLLVGFVAFVVTAVSTMLSRADEPKDRAGIDRRPPPASVVAPLVTGLVSGNPAMRENMAKRWEELVAARNARLDGKQIGVMRGANGTRRFVLPSSNTNVEDMPGVVPMAMRDEAAVSAGGIKAMYSRKKGSPEDAMYSDEQLNAMHRDDLLIITWVNGSDPVHQFKKADLQNRPTTMISSRDRDSGELRAGLRSIHENMKWHRGPIVVISPGTVPNWLNLADERVSVIHQDALTDELDERYTANTNTVEQTLYRVPGATLTYLHFNDDYLVQRPTTAAQFFDPHGGGPALLFEANVVAGSGSAAAALKRTKKIWLASVYNTHGFAELLFGRARRYFIKHAPFSYCRSIAAGIHAHFKKELHENAKSHPFRDHTDVLFPFLHHYVGLEGPDVAYKSAATALNTPVADVARCPPVVGRIGDRANSTLIILGNSEPVSQATLNRLQSTAAADRTAFLALNDGFSTASVAVMLGDYLAKAFPNPAPWERDHPSTELPAPLLHRAMDIVVRLSSCASVCPAVRSAASLGFPFARKDAEGISRIFAVVDDNGVNGTEACNRQCHGGKRGHRGLYSQLTANVIILRARASDDPLTVIARICAEAKNETELDTCLVRAGKPLSLLSKAVPRPLIVVTTPDPVFGECVMQRYLSPLSLGGATKDDESVAPIYTTTVYQRPRVGEPRPRNGALALRVNPLDSTAYLETFPIPATDHFESRLP